MAEIFNPQYIGTFVNDTSAVGAVNNNLAAISTAFLDTLSRSGGLPNQMQATLDMNSNEIINLPAPTTTTSPLRLADVGSFPAGTFTPASTGTSGHVVPFLDGTNTWTGTNTYQVTPNWSLSTTPSVYIQAVSSGTTSNSTNVFEVNTVDNSNNGTGGQFGFGIGSYFTTGGTGTQGDKGAIIGGITVVAPPISGFSPFYAGVLGLSTAQVNLGGTSSSTLSLSSGQIWGSLGWGQTTSASTFLSNVSGLVGLTTINSSASLWSKSILLLQGTSADVTSGSAVDAMAWLCNQPGATSRFKTGILIDNYGGNGTFPIASTGTVLKCGPGTVNTAFDFSTTNFNANAMNFPGFNLTASGALVTGASSFSNGQIQFQGMTSGQLQLNINNTATLLTITQPIQVGVIGTAGTGQINIAGGTSGSAQITASATGGSLQLGANNVVIDTSGNLVTNGDLHLANASTPPAGGSNGLGLFMCSTTNLGIFVGSGAPTLSAAQGSIYLRTDGNSTSTRLYVNTNGSTTWTNFTSAI